LASITSTGVGSGLDVNTIVTGLMSVEKQPLTQLQTRATKLQTQISAFGSLKSQIANLADVATRLATATSWNPMTADSTDATSVTATADTSASAGLHTVAVQQLAQGQVLASKNFAASTTAVGTGTLTLQLGTTTNGTFTPGTAAAVNVTITSANQTLAGVRDAINAASAGITASIVTGSSGARLVLRTADGAASSVKITAADDDGNATDANGLSALAWDPAATAGTGANMTQTQAAQDAKYTLDGVDLTSASNSVTGALDGVTFTLKKVTTQAVNLNVSVQSMAVRKNVNDFVTAYNALNTLLQNQTRADPSGKNRGALQGDSTATSLLNSLRSVLRGAVNGAGGPSTLSAAGITFQPDGSLALDDTKVSKALANPAGLSGLFAKAQVGGDTTTAGLGNRLKSWASALTADSGTLTARVTGLQHSIDDNQKQQDTMQDKLDRTEARLRAQYQTLDTQMSGLNQQMARMKSALGLS
jgi:flagellar hook-associated protein 2